MRPPTPRHPDRGSQGFALVGSLGYPKLLRGSNRTDGVAGSSSWEAVRPPDKHPFWTRGWLRTSHWFLGLAFAASLLWGTQLDRLSTFSFLRSVRCSTAKKDLPVLTHEPVRQKISLLPP